MKKSNLVLIALAATTLVVSQLDCVRFQEKELATGGTVSVEKCSFLINGQDAWEKYEKLGIEMVNFLYRDKKGNFYDCANDSCIKI